MLFVFHPPCVTHATSPKVYMYLENWRKCQGSKVTFFSTKYYKRKSTQVSERACLPIRNRKVHNFFLFLLFVHFFVQQQMIHWFCLFFCSAQFSFFAISLAVFSFNCPSSNHFYFFGRTMLYYDLSWNWLMMPSDIIFFFALWTGLVYCTRIYFFCFVHSTPFLSQFQGDSGWWRWAMKEDDDVRVSMSKKMGNDSNKNGQSQSSGRGKKSDKK